MTGDLNNNKMKKETKFIRIRKPKSMVRSDEVRFVNKRGLKGWELFSTNRDSRSGYNIFHFRKQFLKKTK